MYQDKLSDYSVKDDGLLMWFQKRRNKTLDTVFKIVSCVFKPSTMGLLMVVSLLTCKDKLRMFNFFFFVTFLIYVIECLKSGFHAPPAYALNSKIIP